MSSRPTFNGDQFITFKFDTLSAEEARMVVISAFNGLADHNFRSLISVLRESVQQALEGIPNDDGGSTTDTSSETETQ